VLNFAEKNFAGSTDNWPDKQKSNSANQMIDIECFVI
jgi:hypothetical protein